MVQHSSLHLSAVTASNVLIIILNEALLLWESPYGAETSDCFQEVTVYWWSTHWLDSSQLSRCCYVYSQRFYVKFFLRGEAFENKCGFWFYFQWWKVPFNMNPRVTVIHKCVWAFHIRSQREGFVQIAKPHLFILMFKSDSLWLLIFKRLWRIFSPTSNIVISLEIRGPF